MESHHFSEDMYKRIIDEASSEEDNFCISLACKPFRNAIKGVLSAKGKALVTSARGVVSSVERMSWVLRLPQNHQPAWLVHSVPVPPSTRFKRYTMTHQFSYCPTETQAADRIALYGPLDVLQHAVDKLRYRWGETTMKAATRGGNIKSLKWLGHMARALPSTVPSESDCEDSQVWIPDDCVDIAAEAGHLDIVEYLLYEGKDWVEYAFIGACKGGHLEILQFAVDDMEEEELSV